MNRRNEGVIKLYYKNQHGVDITKCCASCKHKLEGGRKDNERLCKLTQKIVRADDLCSSWELTESPKLEVAGKGGGRIKKPHYIQWCKEHGINPEWYEQQFGSRYLTNV